jgi:subtilisin family serine protease
MTELGRHPSRRQDCQLQLQRSDRVDHIVKPDLVAPGNRLVSLRVAGSTLDTTYPQYQVAPSSGTAKYYVLSGTSMATPVVSGAVALMLQQNPSLDSRSSESALDENSVEGRRTIHLVPRQLSATFTTTSMISSPTERAIWISTPLSATPTSRRE